MEVFPTLKLLPCIETTIVLFKMKNEDLDQALTNSWEHIATCWPLSQFVSTNPLAGFEDLPFEEALKEALFYFERPSLPEEMEQVNQESIKWLQLFFDDGQAAIPMPSREKGLLSSVLSLLVFDSHIPSFFREKELLNWINSLADPKKLIQNALIQLDIPRESYETFLTLILTSLPGWAAYTKYIHRWKASPCSPFQRLEEEFSALRLLFISIFYPKAKELLSFSLSQEKRLSSILSQEAAYRQKLVQNLAKTPFHRLKQKDASEAQFVFCIDSRSERLRRALESIGPYETYGYAGFFGLPLLIENPHSKESHPSCPITVPPLHRISLVSTRGWRVKWKSLLKKIYESLKNSFAAPFALAEFLGPFAAILLVAKTFFPNQTAQIRKRWGQEEESFSAEVLESIPFKDQCHYALQFLQTIGLVSQFSPFVILAGHGAKTENNAFSTALNCAACGGRDGSMNASLLSLILNQPTVRAHLENAGVNIPKSTYFLAAHHNSTTGEFLLLSSTYPATMKDRLKQIQEDLRQATIAHQEEIVQTFFSPTRSLRLLKSRAFDWAEMRPEWALVGNASFIVGPRELTKGLSLDGRAFLHSYNYELDTNGLLLEKILNYPMMVAQWINAQYFFSSLNNTAFGSGNKLTQNITGKIGLIQGNGSDLMHGLPFQSLFQSGGKRVHDPLRLLCLVYAPKEILSRFLSQESKVAQLIRNEWIYLSCIDPQESLCYSCTRELKWILDEDFQAAKTLNNNAVAR